MLPKKDSKRVLFNRDAIALSIPVTQETLLDNIATNIDTLMLGFLGTVVMSAVSIASQFVLIFSFLIESIIQATMVTISQFWGRRDRKSLLSGLFLSFKTGFFIGFAVFILTQFFSRRILGFYTNIPELIDAGEKYLRIVSISFLIIPIYRIYYVFLSRFDEPLAFYKKHISVKKGKWLK